VPRRRPWTPDAGALRTRRRYGHTALDAAGDRDRGQRVRQRVHVGVDVGKDREAVHGPVWCNQRRGPVEPDSQAIRQVLPQLRGGARRTRRRARRAGAGPLASTGQGARTQAEAASARLSAAGAIDNGQAGLPTLGGAHRVAGRTRSGRVLLHVARRAADSIGSHRPSCCRGCPWQRRPARPTRCRLPIRYCCRSRRSCCARTAARATPGAVVVARVSDDPVVADDHPAGGARAAPSAPGSRRRFAASLGSPRRMRTRSAPRSELSATSSIRARRDEKESNATGLYLQPGFVGTDTALRRLRWDPPLGSRTSIGPGPTAAAAKPQQLQTMLSGSWPHTAFGQGELLAQVLGSMSGCWAACTSTSPPPRSSVLWRAVVEEAISVSSCE